MMRLYAATLFVSAMLLFIVEPMVGKMILPTFGGTPAVWNACMVFFQAMLLAGYAYAHASTAWLGVRRQAALHLGLLLVPLVVLPIDLAGNYSPAAGDPTFWLLGRLLIYVGLPFFVISSTAPLLQKWFAATDDPAAKDPYFLYAASNVGSLLALLGYPLVIERALALDEQSRIWTIGYGLLILLAVMCAVVMWRSTRRSCPTVAPDEASPDAQRCDTQTPVPTSRPWAERLWWVFLAAVPSSLMLGVTTHMTTNMAAVPLLWVIPLAMYLLTFVLVFARRPILPHAWMVRLLPFALLMVVPLLFISFEGNEYRSLAAHLLLFFLVAMVCHGELARCRPDVSRLTEFYLLMSVGGMVGGLFNALVAPQVFNTVLEYPLAMCAACFAIPSPAGSASSPHARRMDLVAPAGVAVLAGLLALVMYTTSLGHSGLAMLIMAGLLCMVCFALKDRPIRFGLACAAAMGALIMVSDVQAGRLLHVERNFFGVKKVIIDPTGSFRAMVHGTTCHGIQRTDPGRANEPLAYYHRSGPIGDIFATANRAGPLTNVGIIGLGGGSLAAYAEPGQHFTFYEIDPAVERIARDRRYFTFLSDCRGTCDVVLGDGRLTMATAPDHHFDMIVLDAFSSDAIPTHLLTRQAVAMYLSKLKPGGLLAFHVSSRFFTFEPLLANVAVSEELACLTRADFRPTQTKIGDGRMGSQYLVMSKPGPTLALLSEMPGWRQPTGRIGLPVWTDQYCDVLALFKPATVSIFGPRNAMAGSSQ